MNICFVFKHCPYGNNLKDSGIGAYIFQSSKILSVNNSVFVLTQMKQNTILKSKNLKIFGLKEIIIPFINSRTILFILHNIRIAWNLIKLNNKYHFDVIEFANWEQEGLVYAILSLIFKFHSKIVCRIHTGTLDHDKINNNLKFSTKFIHLTERILLNLPNTYLSTSTSKHAKYSKNIYHIVSKKISIIPLSIEIPRNLKLKNNRNTNNELNILYVGRMEDRKGIKILIDSMTKVLSKNPKAVFYLIGKGYIDIFSILHNKIPTKYLPRIRYQGYIDSRKQMDYFYRFADICVFPSIYESFGITITEAMSYGKPVITTNIGGIPEIITDNSNGLLIPQKDSISLEDALNKLLSNKKLCNYLGKNAKNTIKNKFSPEKFIKMTEEFFKLRTSTQLL